MEKSYGMLLHKGILSIFAHKTQKIYLQVQSVIRNGILTFIAKGMKYKSRKDLHIVLVCLFKEDVLAL